MFVALNRTLRRQRRRLAMLTVVLGLAGAVVVAHSAMGGDRMGDALVMCLAVAETAVVAVGTALVVGLAVAWHPRRLLPGPAPGHFADVPAARSVRARAGPPLLQVFRL